MNATRLIVEHAVDPGIVERLAKQEIGVTAAAARSHQLVVRRHMTDGQRQSEDTMQFVLVIYHGTTPLPGTPAWKSLSHEEQKEAYANYEALNQMANLTPAPPLGLPENATTVRVENGSTVTTEGPYFGAENAVGGFYVLEAEDVDTAVAIASRIPQARRGGAVEVRPSAKYW